MEKYFHTPIGLEFYFCNPIIISFSGSKCNGPDFFVMQADVATVKILYFVQLEHKK